MLTIGIIGGGNMGEALIKGLCQHNRVVVCETNSARVQQLKEKYRSLKVANLYETVKAVNALVLAVKPQDMPAVLDQIPSHGKLVISIAAGLTTTFFEKRLGAKARVVRAMPNMPAFIGEGMTALCAGRYAKANDLRLAEKILGVLGEIMVVQETMMDAVTAVSGSGPAYVFLFVEQWISAARQLGFNEAQAKLLVTKTLLGSAHLLEKSEFDAATLRAKVTSKGGTTKAALDIFYRKKFNQMMKEALSAAKKRARDMAK